MALAAMGIPDMDKGATETRSIGRLRNDHRTDGWLDIGWDGWTTAFALLFTCSSLPQVHTCFFFFLSFPSPPLLLLPFLVTWLPLLLCFRASYRIRTVQSDHSAATVPFFAGGKKHASRYCCGKLTTIELVCPFSC